MLNRLISLLVLTDGAWLAIQATDARGQAAAALGIAAAVSLGGGLVMACSSFRRSSR
jgi:hypothetical protein